MTLGAALLAWCASSARNSSEALERQAGHTFETIAEAKIGKRHQIAEHIKGWPMAASCHLGEVAM